MGSDIKELSYSKMVTNIKDNSKKGLYKEKVSWNIDLLMYTKASLRMAKDKEEGYTIDQIIIDMMDNGKII